MGRLAVILLDTHVWIWWTHRDPLLPREMENLFDQRQETLAVSAISLWEVAKLVERGATRGERHRGEGQQ